MVLLKTEDVESGRYAAFALANLAANANHREQIVDEGAPGALVALACCEVKKPVSVFDVVVNVPNIVTTQLPTRP